MTATAVEIDRQIDATTIAMTTLHTVHETVIEKEIEKGSENETATPTRGEIATRIIIPGGMPLVIAWVQGAEEAPLTRETYLDKAIAINGIPLGSLRR